MKVVDVYRHKRRSISLVTGQGEAVIWEFRSNIINLRNGP